MAYIKAISYYLPDQVLTNEDLAREFPEWSAEKVAAKVGISQRHIAAPRETAGDLAEKAARKLFQEYDFNPAGVDFLLLCTQSPDYFLPTTACILQDRLGIPTSAGALDYNLGCSGGIYGLALAKGLVAGGIARNVLLITAETYSKYIHPSDKGNRSIFGDAAAACLVSDEGFAQIGEFTLGTDGAGFRQLIVGTGGARQRSATGRISEDDDGHTNREDHLYMNGGSIFNFTLNVVPSLIAQVLQRNGTSKDLVDYFIFHQANKFMLNTIRKVCAIPKEKFYLDMELVGNTVSSTILIGLKDCLDKQMFSAGQQVLLAGFGVGLSWGGTLLRF